MFPGLLQYFVDAFWNFEIVHQIWTRRPCIYRQNISKNTRKITCTKQGGTEKKMMPIIDEHEPAFFERPFRTQATNAPRGSGRERHFSSMLWRQRRLERLPSSILHFCGGVEGTSRAFRVSGADSSGTSQAFCGSGARSLPFRDHFASQLRLRARLYRQFRASCGSRPGSTDHFEPAAAPGHAGPS